MEFTQTASELEDLELVRNTALRLFADRRNGDSSLEAVAEVGFLGLLVPIEAGGAGWYPAEASLVVEEAGRSGDGAPIIGAMVGAGLVARAAPSDATTRWLDKALLGIEPVLFARGSVEPTALPDGVLRLDGLVGPVVGTDRAASLIVATSGPSRSLYWIAMHQPGVRTSDTGQIPDTTRQAKSISLRGAAAERLDLSPHDQTVSCLMDAASILASSDSLGAFRSARSRLTEYLRHRVAFGVPIASFQAVQHRLVDLYALERRMEAVIGVAVRELSELAPTSARAAAVAVAYVGSNCRQALDECVQLSGGLGFVWDYPLHHEMRRVGLNTVMFESPREARTRLAQLDGW
jgi:alkylation response protein AidB-like acyl-CoA dehydrogenase